MTNTTTTPCAALRAAALRAAKEDKLQPFRELQTKLAKVLPGLELDEDRVVFRLCGEEFEGEQDFGSFFLRARNGDLVNNLVTYGKHLQNLEHEAAERANNPGGLRGWWRNFCRPRVKGEYRIC